MPKSKLINSGSQGCIFYPELKCEKSNANNITSNIETASKLLLYEDKLYTEYEINKHVETIPNHEEWTTLWHDKCQSPKYKTLKKISEIDKCIKPKLSKLNKKRKIDDKTQFTLLQGTHGGKSVSTYMHKHFKINVYNDKKLFIEKFIALFKMCQYLFQGVAELYNHGICHHDINVRNILVRDNRFVFIDYGLSFYFNKPKKIIGRMKSEFKSDRIYESYPYEYLYWPKHSNKEINEEQEELAEFVPRNQYTELYKPIHVKLFKRDTDELRFNMLEDKVHGGNNITLKELSKSLDTYSLGMLILVLILDNAHNLLIDLDHTLELLLTNELKPYIDLLNDMTAFHSKDRVNPKDSLKRYLNLIKEQ